MRTPPLHFHPRRRFPRALALLLLTSATALCKGRDDASIRKILQERVDAKRSTGIVAGVLDEDGTRHVVAAGSSGTPRPLDGDTVFEIGSITKVFTGTLLADMARRGEVALEDPISRYLPASVRAPSRNGRPIRLVDLSRQRSGLPRLPDNLAPADPENPYADYTVEKLYDFLSRYELPRDPGAQYEYSNLGVGLLGHLLARKAGITYEELVTARILKPLEMRDTAITLTPALRARLAAGHDESGKPAANWDLPTLAGAGALRSTVNDMLKFLAAGVPRQEGGSPDSLPAILRETYRLRDGTDTPGLEIGLGWHVITRGGEIVWHNGGTGGYHSWAGFDPKNRVAAVVLSNSGGNIDDVGLHLINPGFPLSKPPKARKEVKVDPKVLETYAGEYRLTPDFSITVTREGPDLFVQATAQPKFPVYAESETDFFLKVVDAQITFVKENGKVTSLVFHQNGRDQPGRKVK